MGQSLPPGQQEISAFPRFGLWPYATRIPDPNAELTLTLKGDAETSTQIGPDALQRLPRIDQRSDFHCVTTWCRRDLNWSGFRFKDFYELILLPAIHPDPDVKVVIFRCLDGFSTSMLLEDALSSDTLLADMLDGARLPHEHGAPMRLVAPQHYGYKSAKYVKQIEVWRDDRHYQPNGFRFMIHPRARVAYEERGLFFPGWLLRYLYRPLIGLTIRKFKDAYNARSQ